MAINPDILRVELVNIRRDVETAKRERDEAENKYKKLQSKEQALLVLLDGWDEHPPASQQDASAPLLTGTMDAAESDAEPNKTEIIRQIVRDSGAQGASPVEIWQTLQNRNVIMHRNYLYAVLYRLTEKQQLREVNGKYTVAQVQ